MEHPRHPAATAAIRAILEGPAPPGGLGVALARLQEELELSMADLGRALAEATAGADLVTVDRVLWTDVAVVALGLVDDLYEAVQEGKLIDLCGGFLGARLTAAGDRARALEEASELAQVWCVRLTGHPLLYDYFDVDRLHGFAGGLLAAIGEGWASAGGADAEGVMRALAERLGPAVSGPLCRFDAPRALAEAFITLDCAGHTIGIRNNAGLSLRRGRRESGI
jgi:hypothetical protein